MEFNKDEAIKAKETAEKKMAENDFSGAKNIALKAKCLFPELEGIQQLLTTLEVYIASEKKINGEIDWYGVLGVYSSENDKAIRKQFHKLALVLHPDKNKCNGAEGAFKIIAEAWSLLSDKTARSAYDGRRFSQGIQTFISMKSGVTPSNTDDVSKKTATSSGVFMKSPPPQNADGFDFVSKKTATSRVFMGDGVAPTHLNAYSFGFVSKGVASSVFMKNQHARTRFNAKNISKTAKWSGFTKSGPASSPSNTDGFDFVYKTSKSSAKVAKNTTLDRSSFASGTEHQTATFWTICQKCEMHYEFCITYLNKTLYCLNCNEPFRAYETSPPVNSSKAPVSSTNQRRNRYPRGRAPSNANLGIGLASFNYQNAPPKKLKKEDKANIVGDFMELDIGSLKMAKVRTEVREKIGESRH